MQTDSTQSTAKRFERLDSKSVLSNLRKYEHPIDSYFKLIPNSRHTHKVSREEHQFYKDIYALSEMKDVDPSIVNDIEGYSRSFYDQKTHMAHILAYDIKPVKLPQKFEQAYQASVNSVRMELKKLGSIQTLDVLKDLNKIKFEGTSAAGYSYIGRKSEHSNFTRAIKRAKATLWSSMTKGEGIESIIKECTPDIGFTRTQLSYVEDKIKTRNVWGRPFHVILLGALFAQPISEKIKSLQDDFFIEFGKDPLIQVPKVIESIDSQSKYLLTIDWSKFDSSIQTWEIDTAFQLVYEILEFQNTESEIAFWISKQLYIHKKIAAPDGKIYWSHTGVPSGDSWTTLINSIINKVRIHFLYYIQTGHFPKKSHVLGDDSITGVDFPIKLKQFEKDSKELGWILNPEKCKFTTFASSVEFLGRSVSGGFNKRNLTRCKRLLVLPEYEVKSGDISAYRAVSLAEDVGGMSATLNSVATRLRNRYGIAPLSKIPKRMRLWSDIVKHDSM